jgi:hypothetical protein
MRAAVIYQHATADRDQTIASALSDLAAQAPVRQFSVKSRYPDDTLAPRPTRHFALGQAHR